MERRIGRGCCLGMTQKNTGVPMDAQGERVIVPAATDRLRGADRSGLGEEGWAEVPDDLVGHPDDSNVEPEFYEPMPRPEDPNR